MQSILRQARRARSCCRPAVRARGEKRAAHVNLNEVIRSAIDLVSYRFTWTRSRSRPAHPSSRPCWGRQPAGAGAREPAQQRPGLATRRAAARRSWWTRSWMTGGSASRGRHGPVWPRDRGAAVPASDDQGTTRTGWALHLPPAGSGGRRGPRSNRRRGVAPFSPCGCRRTTSMALARAAVAAAPASVRTHTRRHPCCS